MIPQPKDISDLVESALSNPGLAFTLVLCGLPALVGSYYLCRVNGTSHLRKDNRGPVQQIKAWGHRIAIVSRPFLLVRLESESKLVTTFTPRRDKIQALTGIQDPARLTEVFEERIIPATIKSLTPNGLSSGLALAFDRGLVPVFSDFAAQTRASAGGGASRLRLSDFVSRCVFCATAHSFFGPTFPLDAYRDYSVLAADIQLLHSPVSKWPWIARRAHEARGRMMKAFIGYVEEWWYADGHDDIEGISPWMERVLKVAKEEELTLEEAAGSLFTLFWDSVINVASTSFWLLTNVLADQPTSRALAEEARSRTHYSTGRVLHSVVNETLRWMPAVQPVRNADADVSFVIDGSRYVFRSGTKITSDMGDCHFDPDIYPEPGKFAPLRFLDDSLPLPRAFGEGKHMCKGIHLATLQIKAFVTRCFKSFDVRIITGERAASREAMRPGSSSDIWSSANDLVVQLRHRGD